MHGDAELGIAPNDFISDCKSSENKGMAISVHSIVCQVGAL